MPGTQALSGYPIGPWHAQPFDLQFRDRVEVSFVPPSKAKVAFPKAYLADTGLLLRANEERLANDDQVTGKALENFVAMEVLRHAEWSEQTPQLFHYRQGRDEVDLVPEDRAGNIAAIEVKASASVRNSDWRTLARRCRVAFWARVTRMQRH